MSVDDSTLRAYYAARAPVYDRVYRIPERQADLRRLQDWLPTLFEGRRILEIACGTGYWTQFVALVAKHVVATDVSMETLQLTGARNASGIRFRHRRYQGCTVVNQAAIAYRGVYHRTPPESMMKVVRAYSRRPGNRRTPSLSGVLKLIRLNEFLGLTNPILTLDPS